MATTALKAEGYATMSAAVDAMRTATNGTTDVDAGTIGEVVKIGSANWGYWVLYSQIDGS